MTGTAVVSKKKSSRWKLLAACFATLAGGGAAVGVLLELVFRDGARRGGTVRLAPGTLGTDDTIAIVKAAVGLS